MTDKALISELTWRSLEMQKHAFPGMPHYIMPDEVASIMRPSQRKDELRIHVMSLGIIANNEKDLRSFMKMVEKRKARIYVSEKMTEYGCKTISMMIEDWRDARKEGAAKVGGQISADKRKAKSAAGAKLIEARWGMPSKTWPTHVLLKEADMSYNTAKTILGKRPIAQYNYQAKMKRKANKK